MTSAMEMMTSDFQGNMWFASSTQGVMKVITSQFVNVTRKAGLADGVANAVCLSGGRLYVGTDQGLRIIDADNRTLENELTAFVGNARIRCISEDAEGNLWLSAFTHDLGVVCYTDEYTRGNAVRTAEYARQIAELSGKDADECEKVYYAALLHDVGLVGIPVEPEITRITFEAVPAAPDGEQGFSAPSFVLFDAYDRRIHDHVKTIDAYHYQEYGEFWFDGHSVQTSARKIETTVTGRKEGLPPSGESRRYEIVMGRYEDHLKFRLTGPACESEVTVALPGSAEAAYVALTDIRIN